MTAHVAKTWDVCQQIARRPHVRWLLPLFSPQTSRFVAAFGTMREAYRRRALRYAMFTAREG